MDKNLKRYFWVVHVALILVTALLFALAANNVIGGFLSPFAVNSPPPGVKPEVGKVVSKPMMGRTQEKLWGKDPVVEPAPTEVKPEEQIEDVEVAEQIEGEYPTSELPVTLTGTMVADDASWSMALMVDNSSRASFMAKQDEELLDGGAKLVKIERDRIVVERAGQLEQIELNETGKIARVRPGLRNNNKSRSRSMTGKPLPGISSAIPKVSAKTTPKTVGSSGAAASLKAGIRKINENQFEVSRKTLDDVVKNPAKFRDGTRPIPNYKGGKVNGFKLVNMKPGSIYYDLGIRPGDVITAVNGKPLDSPNRALELYQKLGSLNNVSLEVERNGQKRQLSFNIK